MDELKPIPTNPGPTLVRASREQIPWREWQKERQKQVLRSLPHGRRPVRGGPGFAQDDKQKSNGRSFDFAPFGHFFTTDEDLSAGTESAQDENSSGYQLWV